MLFGIQVSGSAITILLFSFLEFAFLLPIFLYCKDKQIAFHSYVKKQLYKPFSRRKTIENLIYAIIFCIAMLLFSSFIITGTAIAINIIFGEWATIVAVENANSINISEPGDLDIFLYATISFCIVAPCEELFFRSFLLHEPGLSLRSRVIVSTFSFYVYHVFASFNIFTFLLYLPYYTVWGFLLCIQQVYIAKYRTLFPIITHGLFNFLLFLI